MRLNQVNSKIKTPKNYHWAPSEVFSRQVDIMSTICDDASQSFKIMMHIIQSNAYA
ncbi:MAG: hypothetical protein ACI8RD_002521 [Bacillariaceae sp.]|jgi:hypothetical protein